MSEYVSNMSNGMSGDACDDGDEPQTFANESTPAKQTLLETLFNAGFGSDDDADDIEQTAAPAVHPAFGSLLSSQMANDVRARVVAHPDSSKELLFEAKTYICGICGEDRPPLDSLQSHTCVSAKLPFGSKLRFEEFSCDSKPKVGLTPPPTESTQGSVMKGLKETRELEAQLEQELAALKEVEKAQTAAQRNESQLKLSQMKERRTRQSLAEARKKAEDAKKKTAAEKADVDKALPAKQHLLSDHSDEIAEKIRVGKNFKVAMKTPGGRVEWKGEFLPESAAYLISAGVSADDAPCDKFVSLFALQTNADNLVSAKLLSSASKLISHGHVVQPMHQLLVSKKVAFA
jgi:hypothetical protein